MGFPVFCIRLASIHMKFVLSSLITAAVSTTASATFVEYYTVKTNVTHAGVALDVYTLFARFNGATDTLLIAYNMNRLDGTSTNHFYHKDNAGYNDGVLMKEFGSWSPSLTGSAVNNRPFDSYLTIGGQATTTNATVGDPSWPIADGGWNRPDIPNGSNVGWYNSNPPTLQGRVGLAAPANDSVRLGQFVVDAGTNGGTWTLRLGYNNGVSTQVLFGESTFTLPAPGAVALLATAALVRRRRR